jgi:hypothetical protein
VRGGGPVDPGTNRPVETPATSVDRAVNPADDAEYQEYLTNKRAAANAAREREMSVGDVFHRLIDAVGWNHTAERDAAHAAITKAVDGDTAAQDNATA